MQSGKPSCTHGASEGLECPMTDAGFGDEVPEVELAMAELQDCGPPPQDRELDLSTRTGFCRVAWRGSSTAVAPGRRVLACFLKSRAAVVDSALDRQWNRG